MVLRENRAVQVLLRVIPEELNARVDGNVVWVSQDGATWSLLPLWVGEGLPADAKRAQSKLAHVSNSESFDIPVVTARRMSPGAREILDHQGFSWADASGRARIVVPGQLYVTRLDPIPVDRPRSFTWSAAVAAVAETVLALHARHGRNVNVPIDQVTEIAVVAGVSQAHTARVLRQFDERGYTAKTGAERGSSATREFRDAGRMLSDWAAHSGIVSDSGQVADFHVPWREVEDSLFPLTNAFAGWDWAVTSEAAADRIAPYLTNVPTLEVYVPAGHFFAMADRLSKEIDVTPVESGGRIRILASEAHIFRLTDEVKGARTASTVRVYADLLRHGGRSSEAAEHLREVAIGF